MQVLRPRRQHQVFLHHLAKHGAQSGCMFSVLKATEKHVESHQKKKRPVFDKYAAVVASFVESYIEANQIHPKISEVVRGTGGSKSTIRRILNEFNLDKNAFRCKEVCVDGPDDMKLRHTTLSATECMPSNNINNKNSACPCSDEFKQLAPEAVRAQVELLADSMDSETDTEQLLPEVVSAQAEVLIDSTDSETDTEGIDISGENLEKKGHSSLTDPTLSRLLDQNKAEANRRVAPLMEVLQQKSSGSSRRVHLSASGGIENDLSWDKTLLSIMPTSVGGKVTSGGKDEQPKVDWGSIGHPSSSSEKIKESSENASGLKNTVKLMSLKAKSILSALSGLQLQNALKSDAEVFKDLKKIELFPRMGNVYAHAILQFKDIESMEKALKLKIITIVGEQFSLNSIMGDYTQPAGLGKRSVFQAVMQGMVGGQKKKDVSSEILHSLIYSRAEDKKSDVCMQAQPVSRAIFSQTITLVDCPNNINLQSIDSFFSVFGKVQTTYSLTANNRAVYVEFENESDKKKALKVQQFTVDGCSFLIRPDALSDAVVVRLKSEQARVNHKAVVKICRKYGSVEKVFLRRFKAMDVQFRAEERDRIEELLNSLCRDEYLKGKYKLSIVCDGYIKADVFQKVENPVLVLRQLVSNLSELLSTKLDTLKQLAADIERMNATNKDIILPLVLGHEVGGLLAALERKFTHTLTMQMHYRVR